MVDRILPGHPALRLIEQMPDIMPDAAASAVLGTWAVVPLLIAVLAGKRVSGRRVPRTPGDVPGRSVWFGPPRSATGETLPPAGTTGARRVGPTVEDA
ncbi:hypothetical protein [Streptosporangium sandarakinum]|uniref:hypothetical protein n=1 Tax=Streptosporangium sandarakinum TaxID=1260955 RepID=UPI00341B250D